MTIILSAPWQAFKHDLNWRRQQERDDELKECHVAVRIRRITRTSPVTVSNVGLGSVSFCIRLIAIIACRTSPPTTKYSTL